jgi:hypothetical protein
MRTLILLALALMLQQDGEQYPGQRNHAAPPEGWFCQHQYSIGGVPQVPEDHICACARTCMDNADGTQSTVEDPKCAVYCHKDHCDCPTPCQDSD